MYFRRFEGLVAQGKSPTVELLADWGTTNSTVGELVDILKSHKLLAAASVLLPGLIFVIVVIILKHYDNYILCHRSQLCVESSNVTPTPASSSSTARYTVSVNESAEKLTN